jgi:glutathione synthase
MLTDPRERLAQAVDFALAGGLLKYTATGALHHAPFTLTPAPIPAAAARELEALTAPFNALAWSVSRDVAFLAETLAQTAAIDDYTARLLRWAQAGPRNQPLELLISRSDYFLTGAEPVIRQVELNTIAASYPALAARIQRLHRWLRHGEPDVERLVSNDPAAAIADAMAEAVRRYGTPGAVCAMVVVGGESNVFDQRLLELELLERGVETLRVTLEEIGENGVLREGHLMLYSRTVALVYYRAGYAPEHLAVPVARAGMERVVNSSAIAIPTPAMHLAGTKKVQQVLAHESTLRRFVDEATARRLESCFAALHGTEDLLETPHGPQPAWRVALGQPGNWVLKPQREGGGNNRYNDDLVVALQGATAAERGVYILMERIRPRPHTALLVREGQAKQAECVSEIGRFGTLLANGPTLLHNRDVGYLVRTRPAHLDEGGISAGFGFLDSLMLTDE